MTELRGRARDPREGEPIWSVGRRVTAGLAPFERRLSPRATIDDLWAALEATCEKGGPSALAKDHRGAGFISRDADRYRAFVRQAREFYVGAGAISSAAKPLPAYYFVLNLAKAYLTLANPSDTRADKIMHGVSAEPDVAGSYAFEDAQSKAHLAGVFPLLAGVTGARNKTPVTNPVRVAELLPYLLEATDEYSAMSKQLPRLLQVESVEVLQAEGEAWLRLEVATDAILRRSLRPKGVSERDAGLFAQKFDFVGNDSSRGLSVFESADSVIGARRKATWLTLAEQLDRSLVGIDRSQLGGRCFITLDERPGLLSYEAVTFLLTHHLSEMVRYRPRLLDEMLRSQYAWVLTTWVSRACDNFLLTLASRITGEEHRIRG